MTTEGKSKNTNQDSTTVTVNISDWPDVSKRDETESESLFVLLKWYIRAVTYKGNIVYARYVWSVRPPTPLNGEIGFSLTEAISLCQSNKWSHAQLKLKFKWSSDKNLLWKETQKSCEPYDGEGDWADEIKADEASSPYQSATKKVAAELECDEHSYEPPQAATFPVTPVLKASTITKEEMSKLLSS